MRFLCQISDRCNVVTPRKMWGYFSWVVSLRCGVTQTGNLALITVGNSGTSLRAEHGLELLY